MAIKNKRIGLFWGDEGIALVEVAKDQASAVSWVSFSSLERDPLVGIESILQDARLPELINSAVRGAKFSTLDTAFSLPAKDVIIRWFVLPWMKPHEIQSVVTFEAKKYLPFPIEQLSYTYHPITFSKDGMRHIGISFVAIRKDVLASYTNVLTQAGLNVIYSEVPSVSLVRSLIHRHAIDAQKVTAVLQMGQEHGEVIVTSQGCVKFVRDFKLTVGGEGMPSPAMDDMGPGSLLQAKALSEMRMSLDFLARQRSDIEPSTLVVLTAGPGSATWSSLGEDLHLPVKTVDVTTLVEKNQALGTDHLCAFGAALSGSVPSVIDLDLQQELAEKPVQAGKTTVPSGFSRQMAAYIGAMVLAGGILGGGWIWSASTINEKQAEVNMITQGLGTFADSDTEALRAKALQERRKTAAIKSLSFRSDLAPFISRIVQALPEGLWFNDIRVVSRESVANASDAGEGEALYQPVDAKTELLISGNAYLEDAGLEFQRINEFVDALKADETFSKKFTDIKLEQLERGSIEGFPVTTFTVQCK
ncbi:MAG: pilus assembly protein PilM [Elusimicrobia bacterium]|nr:pilus assembly protein PilM [Elusimicrobiota bacterium]